MMIFDTKCENLFNEKSHSLSTSDDSLMALLKQHLPSPNEIMQASTNPHYCESPAQSFQEPFNDPDMEPLPLGPQSPHCIFSSLCKSLLVIDGNFESNEDINMEPFLLSTLPSSFFGSIDNTTGSKRSFDLFSSKSSPSDSKHQRLSSAVSSSSSEDSVIRFRPYQDHKWRGIFEKLVEYKRKYGHTCVPHSYKEDPMLARWVKRQRYQHKKFEDNDSSSTMTPQRIELLNSIGFVWHSHASAWQTKLNELKAFKHRSGHCNVPSHYPENVPLSAWIRCQRRQYALWSSGSTSTMTAERIEQLTAIGFDFENPNRKV